MQATTTRPTITVTADGAGVVSHAGTRLLTDLADASTLTTELSTALHGVRGRRRRHDPGRVLVDLAVAIADGAEAISDIAVLADQRALFGAVASDSTCWRLLDTLDDRASAWIAAARARAREVASAHRCGPCEFSVGWTITAREHTAIALLRHSDWSAAIDTEGNPRPPEEAAVAEITGLLPAATLTAYPPGTRVIVRRERPHPGAQLDLVEQADGCRYTALATDTRVGQHAFLDARHRAHARVEDRIRTGRDTGLGRLPSREFAINAAWLVATMIAVDLIAFAQTILLHDTGLARAEPKTLRYRLLHVAARLTRGQRRLWLRIDARWPWARDLAAAFARLTALPVPTG